MDRKYVIKNCPAYREYEDGKGGNECFPHCKDVNNCIMKQVFEKCLNKALVGGICSTAEEIIKLFEVEE